MSGGGASSTNAIIFAGNTPAKDETETWNGSAWSEVGDLNTGRQDLGGAAVGSDQAMAFGGANTPNSENETETWNGASWTEQSELATAARYVGNCSNGTAVNAICFGGSSTGPSQHETTTQEWTADNLLSTVTVS